MCLASVGIVKLSNQQKVAKYDPFEVKVSHEVSHENLRIDFH